MARLPAGSFPAGRGEGRRRHGQLPLARDSRRVSRRRSAGLWRARRPQPRDACHLENTYQYSRRAHGRPEIRLRNPPRRHRALRPQDRPTRRWWRKMTRPSAMTAKMTAFGGLGARLADNESWLWRFMLAPAIIYIVALVGFPFLLSLYYSLSSVTVASREVHFVGLENFRHVVESQTFWLSLKNTLIITIVSQFFILVLANILAMALLVDFRGKWLVRLLILLPWLAPISLGSIGWLWIFDSIYSIINWTARPAGLPAPNDSPLPLDEPTLAHASIIILNV